MMRFIAANRGYLLKLYTGKARNVDPQAVPLYFQSLEDLPRNPALIDITIGFSDTATSELDTPDLVVVPMGEVDEFIAWCTTYLPPLTPITGLMRVVSRENVIWEQISSLRPRRFTQSQSACFIAAMLGEALSEILFSNQQIANLHWVACTSCLSYSFARAWAAGYPASSLPIIASRWDQARTIANQGPRHLSRPTIEDAWRIIWTLCVGGTSKDKQSLDRKSGIVLEALNETQGNGRDYGMWYEVVGRQSFEQFVNMRGSLEERVPALQSAIDSIRRKPELMSSPVGPAAIGFLISRLSPASLDYLGLARSLSADFSAGIFWYCLFVGLHPASNIWSYQGSMARRLLRQFRDLRSIELPTQCDLAIEELAIIKNSSSVNQLRGSGGEFLRVELVPCVDASIRWPSQRASDAEAGTRLQNSHALRALKNTVMRASAQIDDILEGAEPPAQQELEFNKKRKAARRR